MTVGRAAATATRTCAQIDGWLAAFALGALDAPEAALVEGHLAVCPACVRTLRTYDIVAAMLACLPPPVAPPPAARIALRARLAAGDGAQAVPPAPVR